MAGVMSDSSIIRAFADNWWVLLLRGIFAVVFGVLAFALPGITLVALVLLFGIYALADGIMALIGGFRTRSWWHGLVGVVGIVAGILTFIYPGVTAVALLIVIAAWAIVSGIFEIIAAIRLRKEITGEWLLIVAGIASVIFGVLLVANPAAGALAMVWLIGLYALLFGILLIVLAFRLRGLPRRQERAV